MKDLIEVVKDDWYGDDYIFHYDGLHTKFDYVEIKEEIVQPIAYLWRNRIFGQSMKLKIDNHKIINQIKEELPSDKVNDNRSQDGEFDRGSTELSWNGRAFHPSLSGGTHNI